MLIPAYYSLVQICRRDERANVGVLVFCPSKGFLEIKTRIDLDRLGTFFREPLNGVVEAVSAIVYRINHEKFYNCSQLDRWIDKRGGEIVLTNLRSMKAIKSLDEEIDDLLDVYVPQG